MLFKLFYWEIGDWGVGIGDWGLGLGDWGLGRMRSREVSMTHPRYPKTIHKIPRIKTKINKI